LAQELALKRSWGKKKKKGVGEAASSKSKLYGFSL
jgi:hypothetical protein